MELWSALLERSQGKLIHVDEEWINRQKPLEWCLGNDRVNCAIKLYHHYSHRILISTDRFRALISTAVNTNNKSALEFVVTLPIQNEDQQLSVGEHNLMVPLINCVSQWKPVEERPAVLELLLSRISLKECRPYESTALHEAANVIWQDYNIGKKIVDLLIQYGASMAARDYLDRWPFLVCHPQNDIQFSAYLEFLTPDHLANTKPDPSSIPTQIRKYRSKPIEKPIEHEEVSPPIATAVTVAPTVNVKDEKQVLTKHTLTDGWRCDWCHVLNDAHQSRCDRCHQHWLSLNNSNETPSNRSTDPSESWTCNWCGENNFIAHLTNCRKCFAIKGSQPGKNQHKTGWDSDGDDDAVDKKVFATIETEHGWTCSGCSGVNLSKDSVKCCWCHHFKNNASSTSASSSASVSTATTSTTAATASTTTEATAATATSTVRTITATTDEYICPVCSALNRLNYEKVAGKCRGCLSTVCWRCPKCRTVNLAAYKECHKCKCFVIFDHGTNFIPRLTSCKPTDHDI